MSSCPCGSTLPFDACCAPFIRGITYPERAEQLMRSRFSAFALGNWQYVLDSWHPDHRPPLTAAQLATEQSGLQWLSLSILDSQGDADDQHGEVCFCAWYRHQGEVLPHQERSLFCRWQGHWVYTTGSSQAVSTPRPNQPCFCGSGKKFKKCCGK